MFSRTLLLYFILLFILNSCLEGETKKSYYPDGSLKREVVIEDEGLKMKEYSQSGTLSAIYELDDDLNKNGKAILYFDNGVKKSELFYKNDKKEGVCLIYGKNGHILKKAFFSNDSLVKESIN